MTTRFEGFHGRAGFGRRPALLVIDVNRGFTDPASPLVCDLDDVVEAIRRLLDEARSARIPVVFTTVAFDEAARQAAAVFIEKVPALLALEAGSPWIEIDPRIAPEEGEAVLVKSFASAFFGTTLASILASRGVRLGHRDGGVDLWLRQGDGRRCAPARVSGCRPTGGGRRPQRRSPRGQSLRPRHQIC